MASRPHYMVAVMDALHALGGQATPATVYGWLKREGRVRAADLDNPGRDEKWLHREVRFARQELFLGGLIEGANRGVWALTDEGRRTSLSLDGARRLVNRRRHPNDVGGVAEALTDAGPDPLANIDLPDADASPEGPTLGPVPISWTGTVTRELAGAGWVYSARFGNRDIWKIGQTNDVRNRLAELNKHIPHEVLGERWTVFLTHELATTALAYAMEQRVLAGLATHRTVGERVQCSEAQLVHIWENAIEPQESLSTSNN